MRKVELKDPFYKEKSLGQVVDVLSTDIIPDALKPYLYAVGEDKQKQLLVDRYEFMIYRLLREELEAGHVFCRDSVRFRSLEDDLVDDERWRDKDTLIAATGLSILNTPIKTLLAELGKELEERLVGVNQRILSGENPYIKVKKRGEHTRWTLSQPRAEETINHLFFESLPQIDLNTVLHFANAQCQFMEAFVGRSQRYNKTQAEDRVINACLTAWGTNMGLVRMGAISDIDYSTLASASEKFFRLDTLQPANDRVTDAIAQLPIFHLYDLGGTLHSSSDGQRFETSIPTFNARYSSKHFGLKKGVVAYTLLANHIPITARIIGADEHESHYVFDVLYNNSTDLQPSIHSTDTHGSNQVNAALLRVFGYQ